MKGAGRVLLTTIAVAGLLALCLGTAAVADLDVGAEWVNKYPDNDSCEDLTRRDDTAQKFYNYFTNKGWTGRFIFGNDGAWEQDYKERSKGGTDDVYIDTVDFGLYADHGNPWGCGFNSKVDDQFIHCTEARWGDDYDLEWIILDACSVLDRDKKWDNWCQAFRGLHMILSFDTLAHDYGSRGRKLGKKVFKGWTVRQAWYYAAEHTEGSGTWAATMGASNNGDCTSGDHIWGKGSVAQDAWPMDYWWYQRHNCD